MIRRDRCKHCWVIDPVSVAGVLRAKCKRCGRRRTFPWNPKRHYGPIRTSRWAHQDMRENERAAEEMVHRC